LGKFTYLFPFIACVAYALDRHYSRRSLYHHRLALLIDAIDDTTNPLTNIALIHDAALHHFQKLKSHLNPYLTAKALPLLIELHFLQQYCRTLHAQWQTWSKEKIAAQKEKNGYYPGYRQLFEINADYLRATHEQKVELLQKNIVLVTTSQGKSLSIEEVFHQLNLELSSAVKKQSEESCI
jgi:hypothetical protein